MSFYNVIITESPSRLFYISRCTRITDFVAQGSFAQCMPANWTFKLAFGEHAKRKMKEIRTS